MKTSDFDYQLPEELIALRPAEPRESARLLHVGGDGVLTDHCVGDLPDLLQPGDVMVFNDTRVIPASLTATRPPRGDGAAVPIDILLHQQIAEDGGVTLWTAMLRPLKRVRAGDRLHLDDGFEARVVGVTEGGLVQLSLNKTGAELSAALARAGSAPLPPYIARRRAADDKDRKDYQTVFAARDGSVAAPTAGLHFTTGLLRRLEEAGVERIHVTLHVGLGTFLPVKTDAIAEHKMHSEHFEVSPEAADAINRALDAGRRVIAVGTTAMRTLETVGVSGRVTAAKGDTDIFITPGFTFRICDGLWTNFHLPQSTLLMLVSAFCGRERMLNAYQHAIASDYRFFSYGDASLLWRAE